MKIVRITCRHVRIPLKRKVKHASYERNSTESLVVSCELEDGTVGWGEGLPRHYVTGDTVESSLDLFQRTDWSRCLGSDLESPETILAQLEKIEFPPDKKDERQVLGNPLRCAIELAVLDSCSQALKFPFRDYLKVISGVEAILQEAPVIRYSGIIASSTPRKIKWLSRLYRVMGFRECKVKLGFQQIEDQEILEIARKSLGPKVRLRIDANEAWTPEELLEKDQLLQKFSVVAMEQPLPHEQVDALSELRNKLSTPVMLDESLCGLIDAKRSIEKGLCDIFNLRLSKCGGLIPSVKLAILAHQAGLNFQLGTQVGETGILSAAGRHFATNVSGWIAAEGSFDFFLVREPLTREDMTFWIDGTGKALKGYGLGITINPKAIRRVTINQLSRELNTS